MTKRNPDLIPLGSTGVRWTLAILFAPLALTTLIFGQGLLLERGPAYFVAGVLGWCVLYGAILAEPPERAYFLDVPEKCFRVRTGILKWRREELIPFQQVATVRMETLTKFKSPFPEVKTTHRHEVVVIDLKDGSSRVVAVPDSRSKTNAPAYREIICMQMALAGHDLPAPMSDSPT